MGLLQLLGQSLQRVAEVLLTLIQPQILVALVLVRHLQVRHILLVVKA
jgi:hypothetical protein